MDMENYSMQMEKLHMKAIGQMTNLVALEGPIMKFRIIKLAYLLITKI